MVNFELLQEPNLRRKSLKSGLLTIILVAILIVSIRIVGDPLLARVSGYPKVVDGDSLVLDGQRIRLSGLDAPEYRQTCRTGEQDVECGQMAKRALERIIGGREIECRIDGDDRYRRILARCSVDDTDIGRKLVASGWAIATDAYDLAQVDARKTKSGIWSMDFIDPAEWREQNGRAADESGFWSWF